MAVRADASDFGRLAAAIKASGDRDLKNRTAKAIRAAASRIGPRVAQEGSMQLPSRGGLFRRVSGYKVGVSTTWCRNPDVTLRLAKVAGYERGRLRHPVFGRDRWVSQPVGTAGDYTAAFQRHAGEVTPQVKAAINDALEEIARKV